MHRFKYMILFWGCITILALLMTRSTGAEAAIRKQSPPKLPSLAGSASVTSTLFGIAALSSDNAWAVGTSINIPKFTGQPLIEHWNGATWQIVPGPAAPQNEFNSLVGITALANDDAWAVGFSMNTTKTAGQPLIEHWNGSSWQIVPDPTGIKSGSLSSVTAAGPDDVWAVGSTYSSSGSTSKALILHWNGSSWLPVSPASTTGNSSLQSIAAVSSQDIWAVGSSSSTKASTALIEHWDGSSWQIMPGVSSGLSFNALSGIAALSKHDIWAVGNSFSHPLQVHPLIEHWDGKSWSAVATSGLQTPFTPTAIGALSTDDIWITGTGSLAHWNGSTWQSLSTSSQKDLKLLNAVAVLAHDNAWAVGFTVGSQSAIPLIEHWDGSAWQIVANPMPASKNGTSKKTTGTSQKHR